MAKLRDLNTARRQIDAIDSELVESLARRLKVARELANLKREAGLKIRQPDRERAVLEAVAAKANKWSPAYINALDNSAFLYVQGDKRYFPIIDKDGNVDKNRLSEIKEEIEKSELSKMVLESVENAVSLLCFLYHLFLQRQGGRI